MQLYRIWREKKYLPLSCVGYSVSMYWLCTATPEKVWHSRWYGFAFWSCKLPCRCLFCEYWSFCIVQIPIIHTGEFGELSAPRCCELMKIKSQNDHKQLAEAKEKVYKAGFYDGVGLMSLVLNFFTVASWCGCRLWLLAIAKDRQFKTWREWFRNSWLTM